MRTQDAEMIQIDGSDGEGGGQVLRSCLTLSVATGQPVTIDRIRAGRRRPGLMRQHLTAVQAAARICNGYLTGAELGSSQVTLRPHGVEPGAYRFSVGTAGSTGLVLQTVLPALMLADGPSEIVLEGGTHNPWAPPFDFLEKSYVPLLQRMGMHVELHLDRYGFHPAGGGKITVRIAPPTEPVILECVERGAERSRAAMALVANLPARIAAAEIEVVRSALGIAETNALTLTLPPGPGPGNYVGVTLAFEEVTAVFSGFGNKGTPSREVAAGVVRQVEAFLASGAAVEPFLADQLLLPMALGAGGEFMTMQLTPHALTNIGIIRRFLGERIRVSKVGEACLVQVAPG